MKKLAAILAAGLMAMLGLTALAPSAQAYPVKPPALTLSLNVNSVVSGHVFVATAKADVKCKSLTLQFVGQSATEPGSTFKHPFLAPVVHAATRYPVHATCIYTAVAGTSGHALAVKTQALHATAYITVIPAGGGSGLPNTGGPSVGWLVAGIAALIAGAGAMLFGRRRSSDVTSH